MVFIEFLIIQLKIKFLFEIQNKIQSQKHNFLLK